MRRSEPTTTAHDPSAVPGLGADPIEAALLVVPTLPKGVVPRPRLEAMLHEGVRGPLTLVTAPAGTGKTVLVSSWARGLRSRGTVVWLSLDDSAVGPGTFWHLVVSGLARRGVPVDPAMAPGPEAGDLSFTASVAEAVLAHARPVVLVLDCDGVFSSDVAAKLDTLIRRSAGKLRVVLLSREDPLLPLHRYRLAGTLAEVRMADLAFTGDEAREMLTGMGVDLSAAAMDAMVCCTQGWAAGLRMAAMSLAHRADREEAARKLAGDTGTVAEYLLAEVLDTQPEGLRRLLLETSVVDVLRPGLAVALAGPHADRALSFLVHGNAFLEEMHEFPGCYRYHHLFRELLRAQLSYESPGRSIELHRVAAAWLAAEGLVEEAVRHAVTTSDWESAARYVVDDLSIAALLDARPTEPLHRAVAKIPKSAQGAAVSIVRAASSMASGDVKAATTRIRRAHTLLAGDEGVSWPAGELSIALLQLVNARRRGDSTAALDAAATADGLLALQDPGRLAAHPEIDAVIRSNVGAALVLDGRLEAAAEAFVAVDVKGTVSGRENPLIDALGHVALLAALRGELARSADFAARAVRLSSAAGLTPAVCPGAAEIALAYVHTERYDLGAARHHAARAAECRAASHDPLPTAMLALAQARISKAGGELEDGLSILDTTRSRAELPVWLADRLGLAQVGMLVADGQRDRAIDLAEHLSEPAAREAARSAAGASSGSEDLDLPDVSTHGKGAALAARVDTLVLSAARHARSGNEKRAVRDLEQALRLAAPELSRRAFREGPDELWRLLRQHDELLLRHAWLTDRQAVVPDGAGIPPPRHPARTVPQDAERIYEPLTEKEREVLGHLSELLTTEEIAAVMFISVNTVRTHVRNILRKLAASRRNEAVRRARDLRLIPS